MTTETLAAPAAGTTPASAAPAAATTPSANEFSSFLGVEAETLPSLQPAQHPEPAETETVGDEPAVAEGDETGTEETLETEAPEQAAEQVEAVEEDNDNWLPQEQAKEFPEATLKEYAERRGYKWDPQDESQMRLLRDKLNTDIYVEQLRQDLQNPIEETTAATEEEPGTEEVTTEAANADPRNAHYTQVDAVVAQIDKQATEDLGRSLLGAMGVNADPAYVQQLQTALRNPQTTPEVRAEIQQHLDLVQNAGKIGTTLARGAVDLITTTLPALLPQLIEATAPGLLGAYQGWQQVREVGQAWQKIAETKGPDNRPLYPNLPAYQSKEYFDLVLRTERELGQPKGFIGELQIPVDQKLAMIARVANGLQARPAATRQIVARAVNAGRQQERTQQQRRAAGRAMGAGATSQQFETEPAADPVKDALRKAIAEQNSQADPFRGATTRGN